MSPEGPLPAVHDGPSADTSDPAAGHRHRQPPGLWRRPCPAEPALQRAVAATGECAYLDMAESDDTAIYVAMSEGAHSARHTIAVGRSVPLPVLALGVSPRGQTPSEGYVATVRLNGARRH